MDELYHFLLSVAKNTEITRDIIIRFKDVDLSRYRQILVPHAGKSEDALFQDILRQVNPNDQAMSSGRMSSYLSELMYEAINVISTGGASNNIEQCLEHAKRIAEKARDSNEMAVNKISVYCKRAELGKQVYAEKLKNIDHTIRGLIDQRDSLKEESDIMEAEHRKLEVVKSSFMRQPDQAHFLVELTRPTFVSKFRGKRLDDVSWEPIAQIAFSLFDTRPHVLKGTLKIYFEQHIKKIMNVNLEEALKSARSPPQSQDGVPSAFGNGPEAMDIDFESATDSIQYTNESSLEDARGGDEESERQDEDHEDVVNSRNPAASEHIITVFGHTALRKATFLASTIEKDYYNPYDPYHLSNFASALAGNPVKRSYSKEYAENLLWMPGFVKALFDHDNVLEWFMTNVSGFLKDITLSASNSGGRYPQEAALLLLEKIKQHAVTNEGG